MSITYDTEKWTSPLRAWDLENQKKRSKAPEVVSLEELRYFRAQTESSDKPISAFLDEDDLVKDPETPPEAE